MRSEICNNVDKEAPTDELWGGHLVSLTLLYWSMSQWRYQDDSFIMAHGFKYESPRSGSPNDLILGGGWCMGPGACSRANCSLCDLRGQRRKQRRQALHLLRVTLPMSEVFLEPLPLQAMHCHVTRRLDTKPGPYGPRRATAGDMLQSLWFTLVTAMQGEWTSNSAWMRPV